MADRRFNMRFSPAAWRFFGLVFLAAWSVPVAGHFIEERLVAPTPPSGLYNYHWTKGPWRGAVGPAGTWVHPDGPTDFTYAPGDSIVWETWTDVLPGTNISAAFDLVCAGVTIFATDFHVYANERREGAANFGMTIPLNAPAGDCGVRRTGDYTASDGRREHKDFPVLSFRILAPSAPSMLFVPPAQVPMPASARQAPPGTPLGVVMAVPGGGAVVLVPPPALSVPVVRLPPAVMHAPAPAQTWQGDGQRPQRTDDQGSQRDFGP